MKLVILTIVLDGEPWIEKHLPIFEQLKLDWQWIVVHGAAQNNGSTSWCQPQEQRLSRDGTTEYLQSIKSHEKVGLIQAPDWKSKDEMVNAVLNHIAYPVVLMEIDADEIWTADQLTKIVEAFENNDALGSIMFRCNYFVGPNLVVNSGSGGFGDRNYEWRRAWRFKPGLKFASHEPPLLSEETGTEMSKDESEKLIGRFNHMAYSTEEQVKFKESFYGYSGLVNQWRALQENKTWPCKLARFFPFVEDFVECDRNG